MRTELKQRLKQLRRWRIRKKVTGTSARPRMAVHFSSQHIYVQFVDDSNGTTLASISTIGLRKIQPEQRLSANVSSATLIGEKAASAAREKKIESVVFDRSGSRYHGKVKALADAARANGLKF